MQGFFTGTNWSQSITTTQSTGFKWAFLVITQPGANVCPACRPEKGIEYISLAGGNVVQDSIKNPFPMNNRKQTQPLYQPPVPLTYPLFK